MSRHLVVRSLYLALSLSSLLVSLDASAQRLKTGGMDVHLFRHAIDSKGVATVNGTDIIGHMDYSFGLVIDGAFNLLPHDGFENDDTAQVTAGGIDESTKTHFFVNRMFHGNLHANLGLLNFLVVGLQLPVVIAQGPDVTRPGQYNEGAVVDPSVGQLGAGGLAYQGLGNIVLHAKARLLRRERFPVGLAAVLQIGLPTGDDREFAGEPGVFFWPSLALGWRPVRRLRVNAEAGYRWVSGTGATLNVGGKTVPGILAMQSTNAGARDAAVVEAGDPVTFGSQVTFGGGVSIRAGEKVDIIAEFYGAGLADSLGDKRTLAMEALGGLKVFVEANSYLLIAYGNGMFSDGWSAPEHRGVLGFIFEPSIGDRDGDGYKDDVDQCPDDPEDFDDFADEDGCPDPDNDRDGIPDIDDECPLIPEDHDGDADEDGCPEGEEGDRDGDGIPDAVDKCPDDPEDLDGFEDKDGCPDPDNDKDGILDVDDMCPNDPEDLDGFEDEDGCPDTDNDKDRILDVDDSCPNDPETYNGFEDEDGCPDRGNVVIEENQIVILEKIYFQTDSAEIQPRSYPIIDAVAATLIGNPHITLVEIQGHADERSSDDYNIRLTRDRAAAVLEALVRRGVERHRLRSAGYGERCPIDPGHNPKAWEKNRRVEFKIIETEEGPTGIEVTCPAGRPLMPTTRGI